MCSVLLTTSKYWVLSMRLGSSKHASDLEQASRGGSALFNATKGPTGVIKSVLDTTRTDGGRRDEIFVDIVEKLTCTFNSSGYLQASQIDGAIVVRCPVLHFTACFCAGL